MRPEHAATTVNALLAGSRDGHTSAREALTACVYSELRRRAAAYLRAERIDHTLQATALVHEAYLRLVDQRQSTWVDRTHFVSLAASMMRRILVDHARAHRAAKRPNPALRVVPRDDAAVVPAPDWEVLALDEALTRLGHLDPRQATIVEWKYFGGLSEQEIADALGISRATVTREWQSARAWLYRRMTSQMDERR